MPGPCRWRLSRVGRSCEEASNPALPATYLEPGPREEAGVRQRYERELPDRDLYLVVGNLARRHQTFVIIGLVRLPRPKVDGGDVQQSLDLMGEQRPVADLGVGFEAEQADALGSDDEDEPFEERPAGQ